MNNSLLKHQNTTIEQLLRAGQDDGQLDKILLDYFQETLENLFRTFAQSYDNNDISLYIVRLIETFQESKADLVTLKQFDNLIKNGLNNYNRISLKVILAELSMLNVNLHLKAQKIEENEIIEGQNYLLEGGGTAAGRVCVERLALRIQFMTKQDRDAGNKFVDRIKFKDCLKWKKENINKNIIELYNTL